VRIAVFAQGENVEKATKAGADVVGGQDLVDRIKGGWMEFDAVVATPDMMKIVAVLGRILGPRGLMPSPKTGTVTFDVDRIVEELKKGRIDFKMDKDGNIQMPVGKASFEAGSLAENVSGALAALAAARPASAKGVYIRRASLSLTMSPALALDPTVLNQLSKNA
jgi:large subunit ribosomal protein L1